MNIKVEVKKEDKVQMADLVTECQVLSNLLKERQATFVSKAEEILTTNALSPKLYLLKFNIGQDVWEAEPKQGGIVLPNHEITKVPKLN